jgi:site-specific DNA recombinase|nr:recombinase family protein [uncultured Lachnoclostridium sp.]
MLRCAIYIRVSTEEQKINGLSIEAQSAALTEYAVRNNLLITDYYIDAGLTARKKLQHRKELLRLLEDISNNKIDIIIFTKLDRWFRNIADYYKVQEILDLHKVNWKTIFEDYDTSTANGRLHINIMLSIAQDEADRTSERIKIVFENKRAKGEVPGWKAPLGYKIKDSKLLLDDDTKRIAIDIFEHYDLHHSIMGCVRMAKERYDYKIYDYSIRRMLENKTYIGEFRGYKNFCEALITSDLFYRIKNYREVKEYKNQRKAGRVYLFSSLILCKDCNHSMTCCFTKQHQKAGVKEYHYYRCKEAILGCCIHKKRLREDNLEEYLLQNICAGLGNYIIQINRSEKQEKTPILNIEKLSKKLEKLKDLYLDDLIDKESYRKEYDALQKHIKLSSIKPNKIKVEQMPLQYNLKELYYSLSIEERKIFWLGILDCITVDSQNRIQIFYR